MHLLKVVANGFKKCRDNFTISFLPLANKTEEDKEYELIEIADGLYVFSTIGVIGKNASGKTTVLDLLGLVYDILSNYRIEQLKRRFLLWNKDISLDITFYHDGKIYRYMTDLIIDKMINNSIIFKNQKLFARKYCKTYAVDNSLLDYSKYDEINYDVLMPDDTSILFQIFKEKNIFGVYYSTNEDRYVDYSFTFKFCNILPNGNIILYKILKLLDDSIERIEMINDNKYKVIYTNKKSSTFNTQELDEFLSSGTSKGFDLYVLAVLCLIHGKALIVDEIENHFHKTLVENLINLFKDKAVNKKGAQLIFTTHYCELLDLFNRSDNIYIAKNENKIYLENIYVKYGLRNDVLKSKKFYNNEFGTGINYEVLMDFKKELMDNANSGNV